ncbi:Z1 domain-containing protein [Salimicrobium sp. PL1-032A]|uniref:Z1 domain-containing protein n=1 Tax=Salimicrobium sp. PL1-032A TaxID=3095364 RepID=UPI00325FF945
MTQQVQTNGRFYSYLKKKNNYKKAYLDAMEETVNHLKQEQTSANRPGMLLGKVQSGKTRTFLGIMGLAYDNGYDIVVLLTKGTRALVKQTMSRLHLEFDQLIRDDEMQAFDIMNLPSNVSRWERKQRLAIVVKKETNNMDRLQATLFDKYPDLKDKNVLFIDDEADFASVSYEKNKDKNVVEQRVIASKIDALRKNLQWSSYLQVTATPYSLYLQPEEKEEQMRFAPVRPAFTVLVPVHDQYVGGEFYFDDSEDPSSPAYYLYRDIRQSDLDLMKKKDGRRVKRENALKQKNLTNVNEAVMNFITGSVLRRLQQHTAGMKQEKYAMVVHTERGKAAHEWQEELFNKIIADIREAAEAGAQEFQEYVNASYENLSRSLTLRSEPLPSRNATVHAVKEALREEMAVVTTVNSDKEVEELLDAQGQLHLRTPMNIFIGGQILDRGVTIRNMIGFIYGRNPASFQQDTVLQHSRMYGARSLDDMAVTRLYTTSAIYDVMERIHEFDAELRNAFLSGGHDRGMVFLRQDRTKGIAPCSPNKILLSRLTSLHPHKRLLPKGFQTGYKSYIRKNVNGISATIDQWTKGEETGFVSVEKVKQLLFDIRETLVFDEGHSWDVEEYASILDYLTMDKEEGVWIIVRKNRNIRRTDSEGRPEDAPDTPSGGYGELAVARRMAQEHPALILLQQNGREEDGWRGAKFWWPVFVTQANMEPAIYTAHNV